MSLVSLVLPTGSYERLLHTLNRIADALDRLAPLYTDPELRFSEPKDGVSIVNNEVVLEEEMRRELIQKGFRPDQIDEMENYVDE
jgi:hypothetical protein